MSAAVLVRLLSLVLWVTTAAPGTAAPAVRPSITITAATMTSDTKTGIIVATGNVRISDGRTVATGSRLVLDTRARSGVLTPARVRSPQGSLSAARLVLRYTSTRVTSLTAQGNARATIPRGTLAAAEIALLEGGRVTASGGVTIRVPPDLRAAGARLSYDQRTQQGTLSGGVRAVLRDITATAQRATLSLREQKVVLEGSVRVRQGSRELTGTRVTVFYATGRLIAEGPTHLRIEEPDEPPQPRP